MNCDTVSSEWVPSFKGSSEILKNYKELKVWQKAYQLCLEIYRATQEFPKEERFGLISQTRRAIVSVVSNIAEGYGRRATAEYIRYLYFAYGSNCEWETQMLLSGDLGYVESVKLKGIIEKIQEVERMLKALMNHPAASGRGIKSSFRKAQRAYPESRFPLSRE